MKLKCILPISLSLAIAVLTGCENAPTLDTTAGEVADRADLYVSMPDTAESVTTSEALEIAKLTTGGLVASRSDSREIESLETISDLNGKPLMYVVNFTDNKGYAIISATRDYYPVIAESDEGRFSISDISDDNLQEDDISFQLGGLVYNYKNDRYNLYISR